MGRRVSNPGAAEVIDQELRLALDRSREPDHNHDLRCGYSSAKNLACWGVRHQGLEPRTR